jgi:hypothetical protein
MRIIGAPKITTRQLQHMMRNYKRHNPRPAIKADRHFQVRPPGAKASKYLYLAEQALVKYLRRSALRNQQDCGKNRGLP